MGTNIPKKYILQNFKLKNLDPHHVEKDHHYLLDIMGVEVFKFEVL